MELEVVFGLLAISAMFWLPALLRKGEREEMRSALRHEREMRRLERKRAYQRPVQHVTPTQVRIVRLNPERSLQRYEDH